MADINEFDEFEEEDGFDEGFGSEDEEESGAEDSFDDFDDADSEDYADESFDGSVDDEPEDESVEESEEEPDEEFGEEPEEEPEEDIADDVDEADLTETGVGAMSPSMQAEYDATFSGDERASNLLKITSDKFTRTKRVIKISEIGFSEPVKVGRQRTITG